MQVTDCTFTRLYYQVDGLGTGQDAASFVLALWGFNPDCPPNPGGPCIFEWGWDGALRHF